MDVIEGIYRIVATPMLSATSPDPATPWQARVDVYRGQDSKPIVSLAPSGWFANSRSAEVVALNFGSYAARTLPHHDSG